MEESLIKNKKLIKQIIDFTGLREGKIYPTDIDFILEFKKKALIIGEVKAKGKSLPIGQRLLLERLVDSWYTKKAIAMVVEHTSKEDEDILLVDCKVRKIYHAKKWRTPDKVITVREAINTLKDIFKVK